MCFSALQRAENSSIRVQAARRAGFAAVSVLFSEPKIPQYGTDGYGIRKPWDVSVLFSEPKIPQCEPSHAALFYYSEFQCSSASRKFLNRCCTAPQTPRALRFSALQRAENSSMYDQRRTLHAAAVVSVLFSEPKIPQFARVRRLLCGLAEFQCSSASRKFLNGRAAPSGRAPPARFSALQRAENSSIQVQQVHHYAPVLFQCSSASRKFLNAYVTVSEAYAAEFQCSSASRKFLNSTCQPRCIASTTSFSALQRAENSSI